MVSWKWGRNEKLTLFSPDKHVIMNTNTLTGYALSDVRNIGTSYQCQHGNVKMLVLRLG